MNNKVCGIYLIVSWSTGAHYVGSSSNCRVRWNAHKYRFRNSYYSSEFSSSLNDGTLTFFLLQKCPVDIPKKELLSLEQMWANSFPQRVNRWRHITGIGHDVSAETRKKISIANSGNNSWMGKKHSEVSKQKMGLASRGRIHSVETRLRISASLKSKHLKRIFSPEAREKMRIAKLGNKNRLGGKQA